MSTTISRGRGDSCRPFPIVKIFFFVEALPAEADVCSLFVGFDAYAGMRREKKTVAGFMSVYGAWLPSGRFLFDRSGGLPYVGGRVAKGKWGRENDRNYSCSSIKRKISSS